MYSTDGRREEDDISEKLSFAGCLSRRSCFFSALCPSSCRNSFSASLSQPLDAPMTLDVINLLSFLFLNPSEVRRETSGWTLKGGVGGWLPQGGGVFAQCLLMSSGAVVQLPMNLS